jgi:hypothetical protein
VRVRRSSQRGLCRVHLWALLVSLSGCDPDILLGARPADELPDVVSDGAVTSDRTTADGSEMADRSAMPDRSAIPDSSAVPDGSGMDSGARVDSSGMADRGTNADIGGGNERTVDATPTILWFADHETGDLSAWHAGGAANGGGQYGAGSHEVLRESARGSYAAKLTIDTTDRTDRTARLYRRTASGGAYYSAWFFFSQLHTPDVWWSIFIFRAQRDPNDVNTFVNLWDINVERPDGGNISLSFYDHLTQRFTRQSNPIPLPVAQWTHIEAFFNYAPPDATRITIWQDGQPVLDLAGLGQAPSPYFYWAVGNGSNGLLPRVSSIYIDDAAIATGRLGPGGGG